MTSRGALVSATGCESADRLILTSQKSFEQIMQQFEDVKTKAEGDVKAITGEILAMVAARGGVWQPLDTSGEMHVNAGGTVFPVSRRALLMPAMVHKYISVLLMHHADGLPRDADGHVYLETSPAHFEAFLDELTLYETGRTDTVQLPASKADDPAYNEYHALFMRDIGYYTATQVPTGAHTTPTTPTDAPSDEIRQHTQAWEASLRAHATAVKRLRAMRDGIGRFLEAMEPFFASQDESNNEILSLTVLGRRVSVMRKTLMRLGPDHPLLTRFSTTPPCWQGRQVDKTPARHFVSIVDFARRISTMSGQLIRPPLIEQDKMRHFVEDTEMYGLKHEPSVPRLDEGNLIIKTQSEMAEVLAMTGKDSCTATIIYKGSRGTQLTLYPKMLECVAGKSGLLFAIRQGDTHRFGCFIDGELTPPQEPTQTSGLYKVPLFFFSLSGAYDTPTKIELPKDKQYVEVAGTQGAVKAANMDRRANVVIGYGRLWLGYANPGPAADLSSCCQWIKRGHMPACYKGETNKRGNGTLAATHDFTFTFDEMEIYHVETVSSATAVGGRAGKPRGLVDWLFGACK
ncbi:unnamed protein product [Vitrella brassicaformis CCMP3155]|uniref:TLDc domain-containing protein n=1 Tax=Vitrella brassicaformis (strain CCMP3155) TaxID=1169540 RepID=A0A0G4EE28_VITBC|nr:unnamed protein product [Vitrella brassicaformis CCMP3155]|eukprot:CEL93613.1 unnamed protein product [Vitrella brassicaformis CCMP3155]